MPIDDPIAALQKQHELEDSSISPVTKLVLSVASKIHLPTMLDPFIKTLRENLAADSQERVRLLIETLAAEVQRHEESIREIRSDEGFRGLFLDAVRRVAITRAKDRVQRIGLILAEAAIPRKETNDDEVEEMLRIATELSDEDVSYLAELNRIEGAFLEGKHHIPRYDASTMWEQARWGNSLDPAIDSAFSKLESYGLVSRLAPPNNLNAFTDIPNRYVLLPKGVRFVKFTQLAG